MRKYTFGSVEIDWGCIENNSIHTLRQLEYMASAPLPMPWMTQRLAGVLIRVLTLIGKTNFFSEPPNSTVLLQMNPQRQKGNREKTSRKLKWKNYDFTMFLSRIITSRYIAVKWYLRVYWLLPFSTVDSFAEHRRFFWKAPTILLPSTDDSFGKHRRFFFIAPTTLFHSTDEYLGQSINFISQRSLFLISTDSFSLHQLK